MVRGVNEHEASRVIEYVRAHPTIREFHLRSIAPIGRFMKNPAFTLDELLTVFAASAGVDRDSISTHERTETSHDFWLGRRLRIQLTQWPDLNSSTRGRLTQEGSIAPFFEHVIANEGGY